jgi:carotenoid cleavage dioxygenase-like enzyme
VADTLIVHPHLSGVLAPVRSEDDFEMKVVGRIPDALAGAYYRNGPNPQFDPQGAYFSGSSGFDGWLTGGCHGAPPGK